MNKAEFYRYYLPALVRALQNEDKWEQFNIKGPEFYLDVSDEIQKDMEIYLDSSAGHNIFLDNVAYYFDAKSHGFSEINGVKLDVYKKNLEIEILEYRRKYQID